MEKNKIVYILLTILLISSISISVYYRYYTSALETQISDKEAIISNLKQKQGVNDSVDILVKDSTLVFTLGDLELSPEDLIRYVNNLTKDIYLIQDSLSYYRAYYSLSQKIYNHGFKEEKKVLGSTYYFEGKVPDSSRVDNTIQSNEKFQRAIDKYGIKIEDTKEKDGYIIYAPTVDSALVIFPYFRDRLRMSSDKKHWVIDTYK